MPSLRLSRLLANAHRGVLWMPCLASEEVILAGPLAAGSASASAAPAVRGVRWVTALVVQADIRF